MNDQEAAVVLRRIGDAYNGLLWDDDELAAIERAIELLEREGVHDWERDPW